MRNGLIVLGIALCSITSAVAQVSIGMAVPGISIGINLPVYPRMVRVPGYPVYYAPRADANLFFYDGMYWVYQQDNLPAGQLVCEHLVQRTLGNREPRRRTTVHPARPGALLPATARVFSRLARH